MNLKELARKAISTLFLSMLCLVAFAQGRQVNGTVKDAAGEPMICFVWLLLLKPQQVW